ncbi:hypothetical protein RND81_09G017500 [Saponaria officinalis]|uniref:Uncharacterized protein n=1 Tax=Saponaria officinalis TaxID=3572 RepID=A0AAW1IGK5_SAPOF
MAENASATTTVVESSPHKPPQNNPFVFLFNIPQCIVNKFMSFNKKKVETEKSVKRVDNEEISAKNPDFVKFPLIKQEIPPIKLESEEVHEDTNPIILWQVYALGGFIILKWAWGKWQERKANAKAKDDSPDEDDPPTPAPADD